MTNEQVRSWCIREMEEHGHVVFTNDAKRFNLNIVGIRSKSRVAGEFDDTLCVFWKFCGEWQTRVYPITTDPGKFYLINRLLNPEGCAILAPGQYRGVYKIDLHGGKYPALCQRLGNVRVFRDGNRDDIIDMRPEKERTGRYGINIHRAAPAGVTKHVGRYSAGCQVFQQAQHFAAFMHLCNAASIQFGNRFTYTLLEESP